MTDYYGREREDDASITPTGMSRSYGQQRQASRKNPDRVRQTQQAILPGGEELNHTMPVGGGYQAEPGTPNATLAKPPVPMTPNGVEARNALGGYAGVGQLNGFNTSGYGGDLKAANSMKNTFGRIASRYNADAQGLQALMNDADFRRYFPNAQLGEDNGRGGMINFGGSLSDFESGVPVGFVDVMKAFDGNTSEGWQWLDEANSGPPLANNIYQQTQQSILNPQPQGGVQGGLPPLDENSLMLLLQQMMQEAGQPDFSQVPNFQF